MPPLRLFALLTLAALTLPLATHAAQPSLPKPTETRIYKEVGGRKLEIWIWRPADWKASDHRNAIVFYHGGGWRNGSPNAFARQSETLAARGMVAFSVQYRLTTQEGVTVQDCVKDAKSAFRWVRSHAAELGIDTNKIAAGGGSAGGHLAAALATLDNVNDPADDKTISTMPVALVLFNPALKLRGAEEQKATKVTAPAGIAALSPFDHIKRGHPPTIIFHGEDDTTVPIQSVRDYAAKAKELGADCTVVGFPSQVHAFFNKEPFVWDTLKQAEAFLEKQGLLQKAKASGDKTADLR
jgi:acetyl esterase/lipase